MPTLTNVEKTLIDDELSSCIGSLITIIVVPHKLTQSNIPLDSEEVKFRYKKVIDTIIEAANKPLTGNEFDNETRVSLFSEKGLEKVINKLRALFHPDFKTFEKLHLINDTRYNNTPDEKKAKMNEAEFKKKIPAIKEFVPARLEKIINQRQGLLPYKSEIECFSKKKDKVEEKENDSTRPTPTSNYRGP